MAKYRLGTKTPTGWRNFEVEGRKQGNVIVSNNGKIYNIRPGTAVSYLGKNGQWVSIKKKIFQNQKKYKG